MLVHFDGGAAAVNAADEGDAAVYCRE
jgi:hypothetical protein